MAKNFKELLVWQRSKNITKEIYILCKKLPAEELYGLASQMKRASTSIPSNIAEGYRRNGRKEFMHFLGIASGSCAELETQLILTEELFEIDTNQLQTEIVEIQKMLTSLLSKVSSN